MTPASDSVRALRMSSSFSTRRIPAPAASSNRVASSTMSARIWSVSWTTARRRATACRVSSRPRSRSARWNSRLFRKRIPAWPLTRSRTSSSRSAKVRRAFHHTR